MCGAHPPTSVQYYVSGNAQPITRLQMLPSRHSCGPSLPEMAGEPYQVKGTKQAGVGDVTEAGQIWCRTDTTVVCIVL